VHKLPLKTDEQKTVEMLLGAMYMPPPFNLYRQETDGRAKFYDGDTHQLLEAGEASIRVREALRR